ncbi:MAG: DUF255 domain-containing protein [Synergistaceae bacterium]|nr:DUF255 domain-containing protein [Synergistaceae bacterium]
MKMTEDEGDGTRKVGLGSDVREERSRRSVKWHPWGKEAFDAAAEEDRPVFLSIGSPSDHWGRVMERDCFNDPEVADLLNDTCVSVRVDREERPDLADLFTEICRIQNGSAGWPLSLFLTSKGEPFFAATFLPKRTTGQVPGLADIVPRVKWLWLMQREDVVRGAKSLVDTISAKFTFASGGRIGTVHVRNVMKELKRTSDAIWGGFGPPPKRHCAPALLFLLEYARKESNLDRDEALAMVDTTLRKMWKGGIHDHLGGGFAHSAADERWMAPHFEKLLRDQAMLLRVAAVAQEVHPDEFYRSFAEDIVTCVTRDFTSPESCFLTSIAADSEGEEGRFYLWTDEEIRSALPSGDAGLFCAAGGILPGGNFCNEVSGVQMGRNVIYEALSVSDLARRYGIRAPEVAKRLENDRRALLEVRSRRPAPEVDSRVLMEDNGLMIGALARAGRVFERKEWILAAERAALFLQKVLVDPKGQWRRRYRRKEAAVPALPGDYAALMWGVMELCEAAETDRQKKDWTKYVLDLATGLEIHYRDGEKGGFFLSGEDESCIFFRRKTAVDDSFPSANGMAMMAYVAMARVFDDKKYAHAAGEIESCFARMAVLQPIEHVSVVTASMLLRDLKYVKAPKDAAHEDPDQEKTQDKHELDGLEPKNPKDREEPANLRESRYRRERRSPRDGAGGSRRVIHREQ